MLLKCRIVAESIISHLCWRCADSVHSSPSLRLCSPDPGGLADSGCLHVSWRIWSVGELQRLLYKPIKACSGKRLPVEELPEMSRLGEGKVTASRTHHWVCLDAQQSSLEANFSLGNFPHLVLLHRYMESTNSSPVRSTLLGDSVVGQLYGYRVA